MYMLKCSYQIKINVLVELSALQLHVSSAVKSIGLGGDIYISFSCNQPKLPSLYR